MGAEDSDRESGQDGSDPPGAVSNQNQEEAEGGHADAGEKSARVGSGSQEPDESAGSEPGAASEGSQATGHPENAG